MLRNIYLQKPQKYFHLQIHKNKTSSKSFSLRSWNLFICSFAWLDAVYLFQKYLLIGFMSSKLIA